MQVPVRCDNLPASIGPIEDAIGLRRIMQTMKERCIGQVYAIPALCTLGGIFLTFSGLVFEQVASETWLHNYS